MTLVGLYFPPRPVLAAAMPFYKSVVDAMIKWLESVISKVKAEHKYDTIFIAMDLNDIKAELPVGGGYASEKMRETLRRHRLSMAPNLDDTYFGEKHDSKIDFVTLPTELMPLVCRAAVMRNAGKELQLVERRAPYDHWPVQVTMSWSMTRPSRTRGKKARFDRQRLAEEVLIGKSRAIFMHDVNEAFKKEFVRKSEATTPDESWRSLVSILGRVAEKHFGCSEKRNDPEYQMMMMLRRKKLDEYREMKVKLGKVRDDEHEAKVREELQNLSKATAKLGRRWRARFRDRIAAELENELRARPTAVAFKLCRRLANTCTGKGKRFHNMPPPARPSAEAWEQFLRQLGPSGGMLATKIDYERR